LALHALPPEYPDTPSYIAALLGEGLVQQIADNDLADAFDAFVETGYFAAEDLEGFITEVRSHGFDIRLHADEFSDSGGAAAAARWGAKSADHLQHASQSGIKAMAEKGVIATLLPGTSLYSKIPYTQAAPLINAHCPIAIASDFNPGSCRLGNLPLVTSMAALHCGLSRSLAFAGITYLASCSLGWEGSKGSLHIGYDADFIIHEVGSLNEWFADFGQTSPREVWIQGSPALVTESQ
jgi:imidazolonepropionase